MKIAFEAEFEGTSIDYSQTMIGTASLHSFYITFSKPELLEGYWLNIQNYIAYEFQVKLPDDFSKWNLYLFFKISSPIQRDLKYRIENNTFSSRKIVIDKPVTDAEIVAQHILNDNLKLPAASRAIKSESFVESLVIADAVRNREIKKRVSQETWAALDDIKKALKKSI